MTAYQSVSDSYTLVTSVWFDREQVEGGNLFAAGQPGWSFPPIRSTSSRGMSRGIRSTT